ncbi:T9SS type A sorting domain-containing protein [Adhaeribacter pallidiroseus]|nr:T9SS type A sorting domain-containing protein [Adhaeribacter pallidiroseus]
MKKPLRGIYLLVNILPVLPLWRPLTLTLWLLSGIPILALSQTIQWDKTIGSEWSDNLASVQLTKDGGYILGGTSFGDKGGDKSQNAIGYWEDYWIVQLDASGKKQWDKTIGGTGTDVLKVVQQTPDGGYILGGTSDSDKSGHKSQDSRGSADYWIVKLRADGSKEWDKTFGGYDADTLTVLQPTKDGGYILGGSSYSFRGGDKTEDNKGSWGTDYWIIKIKANGSKEWDKTFGGDDADKLAALLPTKDGGYILGGTSYSYQSGDRTQESQGSSDYWLVKIDAVGKKLWDKSFGGDYNDKLSSVVPTPDGGFLLGGSSSSDSSGDKTQDSKDYSQDYWLVKLNADGSKAWDKVFGGYYTDKLVSLAVTAEGKYLVAGHSDSNADGDKSEETDILDDYWVLLLDAQGNKIWDRTIGTSWTDILTTMTLTQDGGFVLGGSSFADAEEDKTENSKGLYDYWIIKLSMEPNVAPTDLALSVATIPENTEYGSTIGTFTTTDADAADTHTYTLVKGEGDDDNDYFLIQDNKLELWSSPDYEYQTVYHIRVRTNDRKGYGTFEKAFTIQVKDLNEAPQDIWLSAQEIDENNKKGAVIGLLNSLDEDDPDSHTYQLVVGYGDEDNASFTVSGNELRAAVSFDYETKSSYTIRLQTKDQGNLTYESTHLITINNLEEVVIGLPEEEHPALKAYPNPTSNYLQISHEHIINKVQVVNSAGSTVLIQPANSKQVHLNVAFLSSGVYTALIYSKEKVYAKRVVISKL